MSAPSGDRVLRGLRLGVIVAALTWSLACNAKSTGVGDDTALQSGPCFQALVDRNAAQPTTAPNRELGSACETEHGDVDKAWARVLRLWGSDSTALPDYDSYIPADAPPAGSSPKWLAVVGILLVYAVFGTPMRSAARLMGGGSGTVPGAVLEMLVSLLLRGMIGLALIGLFSAPYVRIGGSILLIALMSRSLKVAGARAPSEPEGAHQPPGRFSIFAAGVINDVAGSAIGLLGLALAAQHDLVLLGTALAFAIVASTPPFIRARRSLRARPLALTVVSALLAATTGVFALSDPSVASAIGSARIPGLLVPLVLAAAALGVGWLNWGASLLRVRP